jgi:hypothetical protein
MKRIDCTAYYDFLISRIPQYDEDILQSWYPTDDLWISQLQILPKDIIRVDNLYRSIYSMRAFKRMTYRQIGTHWQMKWYVVRRLFYDAEYHLQLAVRDWIKTLPKRMRNVEEGRRKHVGALSWELFAHKPELDLSDAWK